MSYDEIKFFFFGHEDVILVSDDPLSEAAQAALREIKKPSEGVYLRFLKRLDSYNVGIWVTNNVGGWTGWATGYWQTLLNTEDEIRNVSPLLEASIIAGIKNRIKEDHKEDYGGEDIDLSQTKFQFLTPPEAFTSFKQLCNRQPA